MPVELKMGRLLVAEVVRWLRIVGEKESQEPASRCLRDVGGQGATAVIVAWAAALTSVGKGEGLAIRQPDVPTLGRTPLMPREAKVTASADGDGGGYS